MSILPESRLEVNIVYEYQVEFPTVPASLMRPYLLLWSKGYNLSTIGEILSHISTYGTVEGCPDIKNDAEREMVEEVLPYAPDEKWAEFENERWRVDFHASTGEL